LARGRIGTAGRAGGHACLIVAAALALSSVSAGAAPKQPPDPPAVDDAEDLPVPPIPPDSPSAQAAPLPDFNSTAPIGPVRPSAPGLRPDVFRAKSYNRGDGYVNGSGDHDEGRFKQGPSAGFRLDVPLQ
jgi:hypothetical protein